MLPLVERLYNFMKTGTYVSVHVGPSQWRISQIPAINNTNIAASDFIEAMHEMLLECLN